jgi:hypothetical protein
LAFIGNYLLKRLNIYLVFIEPIQARHIVYVIEYKTREHACGFIGEGGFSHVIGRRPTTFVGGQKVTISDKWQTSKTQNRFKPLAN